MTLFSVDGQIADSGETIFFSSGALLTFNADGTVTYDPNGAFSPTPDTPAIETLSYVVRDSFGNASSGNINIEVQYNVAPVTADDQLTVTTGDTVTYDFRTNDSDADGDPLTITRIDGQDIALGGTVALSTGALVTLNLDGTVTFDPNGAYSPSPGAPDLEIFEYEVSDGAGHSTPALVTVTVRAPNVAPELTGTLAAAVDEGAAHVLTTAELGWTDPDNSDAEVTFTVATLVNGTVWVNGAEATTFTGEQLAAGQVSFVHDGSETVAASFSVSVEDGDEDNSTPVEQTFSFDVTPVNDAPTAGDDSASTTLPNPVIIDVLANNTDPEGDTLQIASVGTAANGTVTIVDDNNDGVFEIQYTPDAGYSGNDTFTYDVNDGNGGLSTATVTVTVAPDPSNTPPDVQDDAIQVLENGIETFDVLANDSDPEFAPLKIIRIGGQDVALGDTVTLASGALVTLNLDSTLTYNPNGAFNPAPAAVVPDSFTYEVRDSGGNIVSGDVAVDVFGSEPPVVGDDLIEVLENETITFDALANDIDPEEDALTIVNVDGQDIIAGQTINLSAGGLLTLNPNGTLTFDPNGDFNPASGDSIDFDIGYTVDDGAGNTASGSISIGVLANDPPTVTDDMASVYQSSTVAFDPLANDSDPEGGTLTLASVDGQALNVGETTTINSGAQVTLNADGTLTYDPNGAITPPTDGSIDDAFSYDVLDDAGNTVSGTITVAVLYNDTPAFAGNDTDQSFTGGNGDDFIFGGGGIDTLSGGLGNDVVDGGPGNDVLTGGRGIDLLIGGANNDRFIINAGDGQVTIGDFEQAAMGGPYADQIELNGFGLTFASLDSNGDGFLTAADNAISTSADGITLALGGSDTLTVNHVTSLLPEDLMFV